MLKLKNRFIHWIKYDAKYFHLEIARGVKNLITWFPTIWKDRDYDHFYIYEILRVKLEKQAKHISSKNRYLAAQRDSEIMLLTSRLITIQQEDLYHMEYMDYHESECEWIDATNDDLPEKYKGSKQLKIELVSENFDDYFKKYPRQYKRAVSGELNLFTRYDNETKNKQVYAMEIAHENQKRSHNLLFKILNNNIERWWY